MRKKSHIALAKGVVSGLSLQETMHHKFSLYVGSIWPDCTPSFLTRRHNMAETLDLFLKEMRKFLLKYDVKKGMNKRMTFRMGKIMHYVADYFTLPHNTHFMGDLKEHCVYEEKLKHQMYAFVDDIVARKKAFDIKVEERLEDIKKYLLGKHEEYEHLALLGDEENTKADCRYAYELCSCVCASLLELATGVDMRTLSSANA